MKKVSFDFDDTLDRTDVQAFARLLLDTIIDIEIWVFTSRLDDKSAPSKKWNDDLKVVCSGLSIPLSRVFYCNDIPKKQFINDFDFIWHLDDDWCDCDDINTVSNTKAIKSRFYSDWKSDCLKLLA